MYVLMIVPSEFPNGDAGAVRDFTFAKMYMDLGYEVHLIGKGQKQKKGNYYGVEYESVYEEAKSIFAHLKRYVCQARTYIARVKELFKMKGLPAVIHINHVQSDVCNYLMKIAKKNDIPFLHDSTEWYSACEFERGKWDKAYILKDYWNRKIVRTPMKVIAISSYLQEFFSRKGIVVERIPVIMDVKSVEVKSSLQNDDKIKFIYAGSPAKKDYLGEIIHGINMLTEEEKEQLELHLLGVNKQQLSELTGNSEFHSCIKIYGRVSREKVEDVMKKMDFSVLLRPEDERYTKAGFPTKSVEAMMHGVAMLCNITSDLGMYLNDNENSIIVKSCSKEYFCDGVRRILKKERYEIDTIKMNARKTAENNFDYRLWIPNVKKLVSGN